MEKIVNEYFTQSGYSSYSVEETIAERAKTQIDVCGEKVEIRMEAHGEYRGVRYKIKAPAGGYKFTYYIFLHKKLFQNPADFEGIWLEPEEVKTQWSTYTTYNYTDSWLAGLDWHCGMTYYAKHGDMGCVEAGCDYAHYWDEGHYYSLASVVEDVKQTIDSFYTHKRLVLNDKFEYSSAPKPLESECATPQMSEA